MSFLLVSLFIICIVPKTTISQLFDYSFDDEDDLLTSYENFNIYYTEISSRVNKDDNEDDDIWEKYKNIIKSNSDRENTILAKDNSDFKPKKIDSLTNYKRQQEIMKSHDIDSFDPFDIDNEIMINTKLKEKFGEKGQYQFNNNFHKNEFNNNKSNQKTGFFWLVDVILNHPILYGYSFSEVLLAFLIVSWIYFTVIGKTFNDKNAQIWLDANKNYYESRFSKLGVKPDVETIKNGTDLIKEEYNIYKYYVEDYLQIESLTAILEFRNKQNTAALITGLFISIFDKLYYKVNIIPVEPHPSVFCICKKNNYREINKTYKDIVSLIISNIYLEFFYKTISPFSI